MNLNTFTTIDDFRSSELWERINADTAPKDNTHVLHSTRIENMIYGDLREQFPIGLDEIEADGSALYDTFPELMQDTFTSLYSLNPRHYDTDTLATNTRQFNLPILDSIISCDQYSTLKSLCEGRELVAYETVKEFTWHMVEKLDDLLNSDALEELNSLEQQQSELKEKVMGAMERGDPADAGSILDMADSIADNDQQIERLSQTVSRSIRVNTGAIKSAVTAATERAQEASDTIGSWGNGDNSPEALKQNAELLRRVQSSENLRDIIKYLGKYRAIFDNARKASFIYGRGEKYDIVLGNDFTRAISSEYAYLATPETVPLFIQKVQRKTLKQYRKRERVNRGYGDIVVCIDESGSMAGDPIAWAKAVALVLLEYASQNGRSCAMVRFASDEQPTAHIFTKGKYTTNDVFDFAESFLGGGTNFEAPLKKAVTLIENQGFENADVMFITDGECSISNEFAENFCDKRSQLNFKVTGIVIGTDEFSLEPFCEKVYRLDQTKTSDNIATDIITSFVR